MYTTQNNLASVINMCVNVLLVEKNDTNIHLEEPINLLSNIWKYGGKMFSTDVVGRI